MLLRFMGLVIYVIGFIALRMYLRKHPPLLKGKLVSPYVHVLYALVWMWGSLLWFIPGLIWIGILPVPADLIINLSVFIPLGIFTAVLMIVSAFPVTLTSFKDILAFLKKLTIPGSLVFIAALLVLQAFLELSYYAFSPLHFLLFLTFVIMPPVIGVLLVLIWAPDLVPLDDDQEHRWLSALKLFVGFYTTSPKPVWVIEDGKVKTRIRGNPFLGFGPGWLMTEPENVVVLQGGTDIRRVVGPGVVLTESVESPYQVVDLRNQIRTAKIDGMTRDGIEVKLPIGSLFRIDRGYKTIDLESLKRHEPWPYRNKRDVYQVVFAEEVNPAGKTPLEAHEVQSWDDMPLIVAKSQLKREVPKYDFKDLYGKDPDANTLTRSIIGKTVRDTVQKTVEPLGYEILGGGVGNKIIPNNDEVAKQQIEVWKSKWTNRVREWQADVQIKRLKAFTNIRSEARVDLLSELLEKTQTDFQDMDNASDYVAYHLLENLLHMARNSEVKEELPESAIPTFMNLQQQTQGEQ